jgi:hypothetical protein
MVIQHEPPQCRNARVAGEEVRKAAVILGGLTMSFLVKRSTQQPSVSLSHFVQHNFMFSHGSMWRVDYEKPMRTGHRQGEMQLSCFS